MRTFHLLPKGNGWTLTQEDNAQPVQNYADETKEQAIALAAEFVRALHEPGSLRIHKTDGTFEEERTYPRSADPASSPG